MAPASGSTGCWKAACVVSAGVSDFGQRRRTQLIGRCAVGVVVGDGHLGGALFVVDVGEDPGKLKRLTGGASGGSISVFFAMQAFSAERAEGELRIQRLAAPLHGTEAAPGVLRQIVEVLDHIASNNLAFGGREDDGFAGG